MKITSGITPIGTSPESGRAKPAAERSRPAASGGDQVALSSLSARLQEVGADLAATPAVDAGRIAEIKQAIADGKFQVNPERIANGLLENVRQMLASRR